MTTFFDVAIILRFGETKVTKEKIYGAKKVIKIWYVDPNNIVISKLIKTKTLSLRIQLDILIEL